MWFVIACTKFNEEIQLGIDRSLRIQPARQCFAFSMIFVVFQNRLASTRTDLGGKACTGTGPALKPRAALGEIGNIALNKDPLKKVVGKYIVYNYHNMTLVTLSTVVFVIMWSDDVQRYLAALFQNDTIHPGWMDIFDSPLIDSDTMYVHI